MQACNQRTEIYDFLHQGGTVITPNNRLSMQLLYDLMEKAPQKVISKPKCMPYSTFVENCYFRITHHFSNHEHPFLLSAAQEHALWADIISNNFSDGLLHEIHSTWTNCQQWQVDSNDERFNYTPQTKFFKRTSQLFSERLKKINAISASLLPEYILKFPEVLKDMHLLWACFDNFTPEQVRLQKKIDELEGSHRRYDIVLKTNHAKYYPASDEKDEIIQICLWLKAQLNQNKPNIAVIIPDLKQQTATIQRSIQRHIGPEYFNISLGKPLLEYPLITHALNWLSLNKNTLTNFQVRLLLCSPYINGSHTEFLHRSQILENSPLLQEQEISHASLLNELESSAPILYKCLQDLEEYPSTTNINEWAKLFKERLNQLGFPGEMSLDSTNYQCVERFKLLFDEYCELGMIFSTIDKEKALDLLKELAKNTIFQPKTSKKPIQILGLLEASGCIFDAIWVCGLTDQCLPQKTKLSAFIPITLQKELQMPRTDNKREWQIANLNLERIQNSSKTVIFSYPQMSADSPNLPSPLLNNLETHHKLENDEKEDNNKLVTYTEDYNYPVQIGEHLSGGTTLLANQAKCPFRAFAAHRLHAKGMQALSLGPNHLERGQIIHRIMEVIWMSLKNQEKLIQTPLPELENLVTKTIEQALSPISKERPHSFPPLIQKLEKERLYNLAINTLEWEKGRPPFSIVALEKAYSIELADIEFNVRVDRIDRDAHGNEWVIDYKTSLPISKPWNEERPEAPQLLLYSLINDAINTLLFLQLKGGTATPCGISEERIESITPIKKGENWADTKKKWREQIGLIAQEIKDGVITPLPQKRSTCQTCDYINLCRINSGTNDE